jgi:hypothetical protein
MHAHNINITALIKLWEHKKCKKKYRVISESENSSDTVSNLQLGL